MASSQFDLIVAKLSEYVVACQVDAVDGLVAAMRDVDVRSRAPDEDDLIIAYKAQLRARRGKTSPIVDMSSISSCASTSSRASTAAAAATAAVTIASASGSSFASSVQHSRMGGVTHMHARISDASSVIAPEAAALAHMSLHSPAGSPVTGGALDTTVVAVVKDKRPPSANNWYLKMRMVIIKAAFPGQSSRYMKLAMEGWNKDRFNAFETGARGTIEKANPTEDTNEILRMVVKAFVDTVPLPDAGMSPETAAAKEEADEEDEIDDDAKN